MLLTFEQFNDIRAAMTSTASNLGVTNIGEHVVPLRPPQAIGRYTGVSSDAMVRYAFGKTTRPSTPGTPIRSGAQGWTGAECGSRHPHDEADLMACHRTLQLAEALRLPYPILDKMRDVYAEHWRWIICGINRHGDHIVSTRHNPLPAVASMTA